MDEIVLEDKERNVQIIKKDKEWYQLVFNGVITKIYSHACFEDAYENYLTETMKEKYDEHLGNI